MKFVATPERDSDNSNPPDVTITKNRDGSITFELRDPPRMIRLCREDWFTLKHDVPQCEPADETDES